MVLKLFPAGRFEADVKDETGAPVANQQVGLAPVDNDTAKLRFVLTDDKGHVAIDDVPEQGRSNSEMPNPLKRPGIARDTSTSSSSWKRKTTRATFDLRPLRAREIFQTHWKDLWTRRASRCSALVSCWRCYKGRTLCRAWKTIRRETSLPKSMDALKSTCCGKKGPHWGRDATPMWEYRCPRTRREKCASSRPFLTETTNASTS